MGVCQWGSQAGDVKGWKRGSRTFLSCRNSKPLDLSKKQRPIPISTPTTMPGTRSEDSTPRRRPSIHSPMPPAEYSIAERPAREESPDRRYYNECAASRSSSRSRSPKRSSSRRKSSDYRERSTSEPVWTTPERPKTVDYKPTLVLKGHKKAISAVKFSPDGNRIASCSADGTIKIWDAFTGEHEHTLEGHMAGISAIAWSPDSTTIASGSDDKSIRLWDAIKVTF